MDSIKSYCKKYGGCCTSNVDEHLSAPTIFAQPNMEQLEQLFNEVQKTLEQKEGDRKKVNMSKEVQKNASHLESWIMNHSREGIAGLQISREVLDKIGSMHWVCVGLTVAAMALNMTIKMHDSKEQCDDIIKESLEIWKRVMKPLLENKEGRASEFIQESIGLIIEGYLYCKKLLDSRKLKRFIFAESLKEELEKWKEKLKLFWIKANVVISVDIREKGLVPHPIASTTFETITVERKCAPIRMPSCKQDLLEEDECWSSIKWLRVPPLEDGIEARFLEQCRQLEVFILDTHVHGKIENTPHQLKVVITNSRCPLELEKLKNLVYLNVKEIQEFPVAANSTSRSWLQVLRGFSGGSISKEAVDLHKNNLRKLTARGRLKELTPYFCEHMSKLQSLQILQFEGESLPEEMGNLASLEALRIHSKTIQELPRSFEKLTRLQFLYLNLKNVKVIPSGILGGMRELGYLQLQLESPTSLPMQDIGQLVSLEVLALVIPHLKNLTASTSDDHELPLQLISLNLPKLKLLVLASDDMQSLENVELTCPSLKYLHLSLRKLQGLPSKFINDLSKLQALSLFECEALEDLPSHEMQNLSSLESFALLGCSSLKAIPEGLIKSLHSLVVIDCPALVLQLLPGDLHIQEKARSMKLQQQLVREKCGCLLTREMLSLPNVVGPDGTSSVKAQYFRSFIQDPTSLLFIHWSHC